jgi:hypothetical protein
MEPSEPVTLSASSVLRRSDRTAWQSFDEEMVVLDVPTRTLLGFNKLAGWVWDRLDGATSLEQIAEAVAESYGHPIAVVRQDVLHFAQALLERGCVEPIG